MSCIKGELLESKNAAGEYEKGCYVSFPLFKQHDCAKPGRSVNKAKMNAPIGGSNTPSGCFTPLKEEHTKTRHFNVK